MTLEEKILDEEGIVEVKLKKRIKNDPLKYIVEIYVEGHDIHSPKYMEYEDAKKYYDKWKTYKEMKK